MPTPQQQNLRGMIDAVLKKFPKYDQTLCIQDINDALRMIMARRSWSGLVVYKILSVPAQYTTGTATTTQGSNVVTGSGTTWTVNDVVNTTLAASTIETGIVDLQATSMTGITPGIWITIDGGNAGEEAVFVMSIDTSASTFQANCTKLHNSGVTATCGSMAGRQFRSNSNTPFVTAVGFTSATRMLIDQPWAYSSLSNFSYEITMVYTSLGQDVKEILTMVNPDRQYQFQVNAPKAQIDADDPRRAISQMPYKVAFHATDPAGSPLWELWPRPTSVAAYPYFYIKSPPALAHDNDILPNGIRSDVLVKLAKVEAARWPGHKVIDGGIYYDPRLADSLATEAERDIGFMKNEDDSTAIMQLVYSYKRWGYGGPGPEYFQNDYESWFV